MRDAHHPVPCPLCASKNVNLLHATPTVLYVSCRRCEHQWHVRHDAVDQLRGSTSAAFRMTARVVARGSSPIPMN